MRIIKTDCPVCRQSWNKKLPTTGWELDEKGKVFDSETLDWCPDCRLKVAFKENPEKIILIIHAIQLEEGNPICFCTGIAGICLNNCRWRVVCDQKIARKAG